MENKTIVKLQNIKDHLINNYSEKDIKVFEVRQELNAMKIHELLFYQLVYAGCVDLIVRGVYRINPKIYTMPPQVILERGNEVMTSKRKEKDKKKKANKELWDYPVETIKNKAEYTEAGAIAYLKNLGYKIFKQTQHFKEI